MRATSINIPQDYLQKPAYSYTGPLVGFIVGELNLFFLLFPFPSFFVTFGKWINFTGLTNSITSVMVLVSLAYLVVTVRKFRISWAMASTMFILCAYLILSYTWVDGPMKDDARAYIMRTVLTSLQCLAIVKVFFEKGEEHVFDVLKRIAIIICILSTLSIAIFPAESSWDVDDTGRKQAFFSSPNNLGQFLSFAFLIINFYKRTEFKWYIVVLLNAMIVYQVMGCDSKTSLTGGLLCFALFHLRFLIRPFLIFVVCAGMYLPYWTKAFAPGEAEKIEFAERDMTFTGRSDVWHIMINDQTDYGKKLLGFGGGGYWGEKDYHPKSRMTELDWEPHQGHNGYLDIQLMGGAIGLILLIVFLYHYFTNIFKVLNNENIFMLFMSVIFCINNITESSFFRTKHFFYVLLLLIFWYTNLKAVSLQRKAKEEDDEAAEEQLETATDNSGYKLKTI